LREVWLTKPWGVGWDPNYTLRVVVIMLMYNEAGLIEEKLSNIYEQDSPRDRLEIIIADSAFINGTLPSS